MKKVLFILSILFISISCNKPESEIVDKIDVDDEYYYVQYEADSGAYYLYINVTIATENGFISFNDRMRNFSQIFGPVKKGFQASIKTSGGGNTTKTSISVRKGNGPFALKATGAASVAYTIDF